MYKVIWTFFYKKRIAVSAFSFPLLIFYGGVILPLIKGQNEAIWKCREFRVNNLLGADCSEQRKNINVPNNLNSEIGILNLSGNKIDHIKNDSFNRYRDNLVILDLSKCLTSYRRYDAGAFLWFKKLIHLNMSTTCLPDRKQIMYQAFSETIQEFQFNSCLSYKTVNLSSLVALHVLTARGCTLSTFPILSSFAPVEYVDLIDNELEDLEPVDMAPYCYLKQVRFRFPGRKSLQSEDKYCQCMRVKKWLDHVKVQYKFDCSKSEPKPSDCRTDPDPEAIRLREECLDPTLKGRTKAAVTESRKRGFYVILAVLLLLLVILPILYFMWKFINKEEEQEESAVGDEEGVAIEEESLADEEE